MIVSQLFYILIIAIAEVGQSLMKKKICEFAKH